MMIRQRLAAFLMIASALVTAPFALADSKTLIDTEGGSPAPALAKSWKKVKEGEYLFTLDTSKEIGAGTNVSPDAVKKSLESKLGASYGVKVAAKGGDAVSVTYTGDEKSFLDQVAKTKIRAGGDVALALESSVSEGGIRAKKADRPADKDEVKATAIKVSSGKILAKVSDSKVTQVKNGDMVTIKGDLKDLKKNDFFFFRPEKKDGNEWVPKAGSLK